MIDGQEDNDTIKVDNKFYCLNKTHFNYTSGMINSTRKFLYGYYEIRFKAPKDKGMWPAFWLAGGFPNEEIDVFELKGERSGKAHIDIHCPNDCDMIKLWYGKKTKWGGWLQLSENLKDGFNVMAVEWQPGYIKFFMNGKSVAIARVNFAVEKTIMANLALPSDNGPFHPGPDKSFTLSNDFEIDYIRVWYLPHLKAQQRNPGQDVLRTSFSDLTSGKAALKKKSKLMYGKNVDHANEGPVISLVPINEKNYMLYVSGLPESKQVKAELKDGSGKTVFSSNLSAFQNKLDFSSTQPGEYKLVITFEGKTAEQPVKL
jgi:beta-glucanase (GH16 family)